MLEIQTIQKTSDEPDASVTFDAALRAIPENGDLSILAAHYTDYLKQAASDGAGSIVLPCLFPRYSQPVLFRAISAIYRAILEFGDSENGSALKKVSILCDSGDIQNTYMVVWNFYYAGTKSARMNDGRWD